MLVDRLWPRGLSREAAKVDLWLKDVAPSDKLRHWLTTTRNAGRSFASATAESNPNQKTRNQKDFEIGTLGDAAPARGRQKAGDAAVRGKGQRAQQCRGAEGMAVGSPAREPRRQEEDHHQASFRSAASARSDDQTFLTAVRRHHAGGRNRLYRPMRVPPIRYEDTVSSRDRPATSRNESGAAAMRLPIFG